MLKKCRVVMLPTNEKASFNHSQLCFDTEGFYKDKLVKIHQPNLNRVKPQHLYVLSDDEIKEGDWIYHNLDDQPIMVTNEPQFADKDALIRYGYRKIIATTNPSLKVKTFYEIEGDQLLSLPSTSESFIDEYITKYNKGKIISDVMVEYERVGPFLGFCMETGEDVSEFQPAISGNYVIIIYKPKESWRRDEVHQLMSEAWIFGQAKPNCHYTEREKYIEERLDSEMIIM